jgi:hypothetical protein
VVSSDELVILVQRGLRQPFRVQYFGTKPLTLKEWTAVILGADALISG